MANNIRLIQGDGYLLSQDQKWYDSNNVYVNGGPRRGVSIEFPVTKKVTEAFIFADFMTILTYVRYVATVGRYWDKPFAIKYDASTWTKPDNTNPITFSTIQYKSASGSASPEATLFVRETSQYQGFYLLENTGSNFKLFYECNNATWNQDVPLGGYYGENLEWSMFYR